MEWPWNLRVLLQLWKLVQTPMPGTQRGKGLQFRISNHQWHQPLLLLSNDLAYLIVNGTLPIFKIVSEVPNKSCNGLKAFGHSFKSNQIDATDIKWKRSPNRFHGMYIDQTLEWSTISIAAVTFAKPWWNPWKVLPSALKKKWLLATDPRWVKTMIPTWPRTWFFTSLTSGNM